MISPSLSAIPAKWETKEELERKRKVYLSFIVEQTQDEIRAKASSVDYIRAMYDGLSKRSSGDANSTNEMGVARYAGLDLPVPLFSVF